MELSINTGQIVGYALILIGLMDLLVGKLVVVPRARDEKQRKMLDMAFTMSAVFCWIVATAFLMKWIPS